MTQSGTTRIDILTWLSKATLDIIGLAGKFSFFSATGSLTTKYHRFQL
jgi:hypothetical protein